MENVEASFVSKVRGWASQQPALVAVLLFGSRAKGTADSGSDWDICCFVDSSGTDSWYATWHFNAEAWKDGFCQATALQPHLVQFCAPTSDEVLAGLLEGSKVLYARGISSGVRA